MHNSNILHARDDEGVLDIKKKNKADLCEVLETCLTELK